MKKVLPTLALLALASTAAVAPASAMERPSPGSPSTSSSAPAKAVVMDASGDQTRSALGDSKKSARATDISKVIYRTTWMTDGETDRGLVVKIKHKKMEKGQTAATVFQVEDRKYLVLQKGHNVKLKMYGDGSTPDTYVELDMYITRTNSRGEAGLHQVVIPVSALSEEGAPAPLEVKGLKSAIHSKFNSHDKTDRARTIRLFNSRIR